MSATPRRITVRRQSPPEEARVRAVQERLTVVAQAVADNPAVTQALEMFVRDVAAAVVDRPGGPKRRVLIRAIARHERRTLRIPDPEAGK